MSKAHIFAGNPLDRGDALRRDPEALEQVTRAPASLYLPFADLRVLVRGADALELAWIEQPVIAMLGQDAPPVFLGIRDGTGHFAIDVSSLDLSAASLDPDGRFEDARMAAMVLPAAETGILAQSRSQLDWHRRHRFCSVCGQPTTQDRGGHVRRCDNCDAEHFPRTDPVAIMLITDKERCLLGQSAGRLARTGMYSALAGFIDQGESIEEAVRREVREEAGIAVAEVVYHSSQPWPFPSSLMIGCHGRALTTEIEMDTQEMADVRWFELDEVQQALDQAHPTLKLPGPIAIAHHLIRAWAAGEVTF
jgi:NAD+ diphosphatase